MPPRPVSGDGRPLLDDANDLPDKSSVDEVFSGPPLPFPTNHVPNINNYLMDEPEEEFGGFDNELDFRNTTPDDDDATRPGSRNFCSSCITQDNDPRIVYTGQWLLNGTAFQTTHSTVDRGARVSFNFRGSRIIVFGVVPPSNATNPPPEARYYLDGRKIVEIRVAMANTYITNQPFFRSNELDNKLHRITIELVSRGDVPYILEHFFVNPPRPSSANNNRDDRSYTRPPNRPTIAPAASTTRATVGNTSMNWTQPALDETEASANTLRALSGVLGTLIGLIVIGGLVVLFRRKRVLERLQAQQKSLSRFWKRRSPSTRPDTVYTSFTTPESIQRNEPSFLMRGSSAFTASDMPQSFLGTSPSGNRLSYPSPAYTSPKNRVSMASKSQGYMSSSAKSPMSMVSNKNPAFVSSVPRLFAPLGPSRAFPVVPSPPND